MTPGESGSSKAVKMERPSTGISTVRRGSDILPGATLLEYITIERSEKICDRLVKADCAARSATRATATHIFKAR